MSTNFCMIQAGSFNIALLQFLFSVIKLYVCKSLFSVNILANLYDTINNIGTV